MRSWSPSGVCAGHLGVLRWLFLAIPLKSCQELSDSSGVPIVTSCRQLVKAASRRHEMFRSIEGSAWRRHAGKLLAGAALVIGPIAILSSPAGAQIPTCLGLPATIVGTVGNDVLNGTPGDDVIIALGGDDTINGMGGNDTICGDDGNDRISGGDGNDVIQGGNGDDVIYSDGGTDSLDGGARNDIIYGGKPADHPPSRAGGDQPSGTTRN